MMRLLTAAQPGIDQAAIEAAVRRILEAIGENPGRGSG